MAEDKNPLFTKEDMDALNQDIAKAKSSLSATEIEKVKEEAKKQAIEEYKKAQEAEMLRKQNEDLKAQLEQQKKVSESAINTIQTKVDSMVASKQVISPPSKDPFKKESKQNSSVVDTWSEDRIRQIEDASARAFWGDEGYEQMRREG